MEDAADAWLDRTWRALPSSIYLEEKMEDAADRRTPSWMEDGSSFLYVLSGRCGSEGGSRKCWKKQKCRSQLDGRWLFLPLFTERKEMEDAADAQLDGRWLFLLLFTWKEMEDVADAQLDGRGLSLPLFS